MTYPFHLQFCSPMSTIYSSEDTKNSKTQLHFFEKHGEKIKENN